MLKGLLFGGVRGFLEEQEHLGDVGYAPEILLVVVDEVVGAVDGVGRVVPVAGVGELHTQVVGAWG